MMKHVKRLGVLLGFIIVAAMSFELGSSMTTFEVNGTSKNNRQLTELYEEKMVRITTLTEQVLELEIEIEELEKTESLMAEAIELGQAKVEDQRIENVEEKLEQQKADNSRALENRKSEIMTQLQEVQGQIERTNQEISRMQSQLEAWGN